MKINCQQQFKNSIGFPTTSQSSLTSTTVKQFKLIIRSNILQGIYVLKLLSEQLLRISNVLQTSLKAVKFIQPHADFPWLMMCVLGICYLPIGLLAGRSEIWTLVISLIVVWTQGHFILDLGDEFRWFQPSKTKIADAWNGAFSWMHKMSKFRMKQP